MTVQLLGPDDGPARSAFAAALQERVGAALAFLDAPPADTEAWTAALTAAAAETTPCTPGVVAALEHVNKRLGAGPQALENIRALGEPGTLAVVTGQQPGLLGGPLLTAHKIAGAIHLAKALDGIAGVRVVPVFWVATEDHDLDEANRVTVLDGAGVPTTLQVDAQGDGRSIGHMRIAATAVEQVVAQLADLLPDTDRGRQALALARPEPDDDFASASMRTIVALFGDSGLVVADPLALQVESAPTYDLLLERALEIDQALRTSGAALEAAGLPAPLSFPEGTAPLFMRASAGTRRLRIRIEPGADPAVWLRDEPSGTLADLRARVAREPTLASGNVVGRVFVQNALFPVLAYIAGPTEIAYQAQVRAAYRALDLRFPLALPRPHATWIDAKTNRRVERFALTTAAVLRGASVPEASDSASDSASEKASDLLGQVDAHLAAWPAAVQQALEGTDPGAAALRASLLRVRATWDKAVPRVRAGYAAAAGVGRAQWTRVTDVLTPRNKPQDRLLSPLSFVARFGLEAVRANLLLLDPLRAGHYLVDPELVDPEEDAHAQ